MGHLSVPSSIDISRRMRWHSSSLLFPNRPASGLQPEERVTRGRAYREILKVAKDEGAELIVMGVQGRGALDRLVFGSTTHHVIREADCPILTVRS